MAVSCRADGPTDSVSWRRPWRNCAGRRPIARSPKPGSRSSPPVAAHPEERCCCGGRIDAGDGYMKLKQDPDIDEFRAEVRAFLEKHRPAVHTMAKAGTRAPEADAIPALRTWTAQLFEAGYVG